LQEFGNRQIAIDRDTTNLPGAGCSESAGSIERLRARFALSPASLGAASRERQIQCVKATRTVARKQRLRSAPAAEPHTVMLVIAFFLRTEEGGVRRPQTALSTETLPLTHEHRF